VLLPLTFADDGSWLIVAPRPESREVRASLLGPSLTVSVAAGRLLLGTWQQVVLVDFDNRPRRREVVVRLSGERR
jgi:thiamine phosphate synthase YjbQ (UPF0047 family)